MWNLVLKLTQSDSANSMKLVDRQNRSVLTEGRNYQMGFAFVKHSSGYETVQPISPCKDFLSDVVWSEHTGNPIQCYGLSYKKKHIFDGKTSYMAIKICDSKYGGIYTNFQADRERLAANHKHIATLLNYIEDQFKLDVKTEVFETNDHMFLLKFSYFWSKYPYLTSLYALLVRMGQYYDGTKSPHDFLEGFSMGADMYMWTTAKPRLKAMIELGADNLPKQEMTAKFDGGHPHSSGIFGFSGLNTLKVKA